MNFGKFGTSLPGIRRHVLDLAGSNFESKCSSIEAKSNDIYYDSTSRRENPQIFASRTSFQLYKGEILKIGTTLPGPRRHVLLLTGLNFASKWSSIQAASNDIIHDQHKESWKIDRR